MIITKTPLRVSFLGGGSDFKNFYKDNRAAVISTSIDKYIYVFLKDKFDKKVRFSYKITEIVDNFSEISHPIAREAFKLFSIENGIELATIADIPSEGSGLGSSSSFTVGLIRAIVNYKNLNLNDEAIARMACEIEIEKCNEPIGKQDQYAAAVEGLNLLEFNSNDTVTVKKINLNNDTYNKMNENLLMFYTGINRKASFILSEQNEDIKKSHKRDILKKIVGLTYNFYNDLMNCDISNLGDYLHEGWMLKKILNENISNPDIEKIYNDGISAGALGGKILGAGAGGFMLFYAEPENHEIIKQKLSYLKFFPFNMSKKTNNLINF